MKKQKFSLHGVKSSLSRAELKKVMGGGSSGPCSFCGIGGYNCCACYNQVINGHAVYIAWGPTCGNGSCETYCQTRGYSAGDQVACGSGDGNC